MAEEIVKLEKHLIMDLLNASLVTNNTFNSILNQSRNVDEDLVSKYLQNRAVDEPTYSLLISLYCLLMLTGALGNLLVVRAVIVSVVRKPSMRTPRNMFIVNLAFSDLLLCTVTMPLTLMEVLTKYWPLGNYVALCKMKNTLQTVSVFVTALTIAAIALDRYRVIVYPTRESPNLLLTGIILLTVWIVAMILASPLFIYTQLIHTELKLNGTDLSIDYCIEDWPFTGGPKFGRALFSIFAIIVQYLVPIIIVSGAYLRIYLKLRYRFATGFVSNEESCQNSARRQTRGRRLKRTNMLLVSITVIFCISWLPLHLFNLIADTIDDEFYEKTGRVPYAVCHMMSMSSACSNPVLYGWLNENFWKEFKDIMCITSTTDESNVDNRIVTRKPSKKMITKDVQSTLKVPDYNVDNTATEMTNLTS